MKERPILFTASMVRAILEGRKTQTRRIVKRKHLQFLENIGLNFLDGKWNQRPFPYGQPGDRLWLRETWGEPSPGKYVYRADPHSDYQWGVGKPSQGGFRWRASIHMPRWASRITLEITGVRVERLQDITNNDALDEGTPDLRTIENGWDMRRCFQDLWEQINGAGSWAENPWVWVIEFKKV